MALVEVTKKNNIAVITMNRPEALNALNKAVFAEFEAALDDVEKDNDVYVVIITGAGRAFIAGADIGEMAPMNVAEGLAFSELGNRILLRVDLMEKPTIAAVNGFALGGGCEMALACDIRLASEKAKFGQPEVGLGIIPGFGGTQRMARIIGTGPAMELIYTADTIDANRALEIGMVNHVVPADQLMDEAMKLAEKICKNAQKAIRASKLAIRRGMDGDLSTAVSSVSPFGVTFPTRMSPARTSAPMRMIPLSSRSFKASSPTPGTSLVISSGPSLVSRASASYSSMWTEV